MASDRIVRPLSGTWVCGCDDTEGTVTAFCDDEDEGPMAFVGTPCGWSWFHISSLRFVDKAER